MAKSTDTGMNRTGVAVSPARCEAMLNIPGQSNDAAAPDNMKAAGIRRAYMEDSGILGNVPPPTSMKGAATTAKEMLKGNKPTVFIDKLGERLAFERTGVRLYDALINKFDVLGSWDGGPSREDLEHNRDEELAHFKLVQECMEQLGADPTAMTPSADLAGLEGMGVLKTITDSRTTLAEALHAQLIAERTDVDGWNMLIDLAEAAGQTDLAGQFREAEEREEEHATHVMTWVTAAVREDMGRELGNAQEQPPAGGG